ncbi:hypothetical protein SAMN04488518_113124 [Pseudovibrio ascidiaceicola]|uniref:Uncharacterized protein n=1 Tax=Pseudovibrio ascidiaceicola TaxID=285279 RepID=A0A1I4E2V6_9HYPH|nr:hypothetical protein [Pseudovibrio ascidiaceicola]SFK99509.1 hypothetical protein SAMN04488518_113124 [Pseudovibrio ascidiaceicola]
MTAEIAILNKSCVALAADSTVSFGPYKTFNSAEKLFEFSEKQPLAVMIYNAASFLDCPIELLIKDYRSKNDQLFNSVEEAAEDFLSHLTEYGQTVSDAVRTSNLINLCRDVLNVIEAKLQKRISAISMKREMDSFTTDEFQDVVREILATIGAGLGFNAANFNYAPTDQDVFDKEREEADKIIHDYIESYTKHYSNVRIQGELIKEIVDLLFFYATTKVPSAFTGIVVAGYGENDMFPSLCSYAVSGMLGGNLVFQNQDNCKIDRDNFPSAIIPFAQKEMVSRFLTGVDDEFIDQTNTYLNEILGELNREIIDFLEYETSDDKDRLNSFLSAVSERILDDLNNKCFLQLRSNFLQEVQHMVSAMPKAEIVEMARSLVELTSFKRKISSQIETVGGPIDVAIISKNEGFVWVNRKHYFPAELNARYFNRIRRGATQHRERDDAV